MNCGSSTLAGCHPQARPRVIDHHFAARCKRFRSGKRHEHAARQAIRSRPEAFIKLSLHPVLLFAAERKGPGGDEPVKAWLAERMDRIEVFYLPSYAPELNPDERLNADMKHAIGAKVPVRTKPKLKAAAEEHMTMIGKSPDRVRAYFQDQRVKYAA